MVFLLVICHIHRGIYRWNETSKFFWSGALILFVNPLVIISPTKLQTK